MKHRAAGITPFFLALVMIVASCSTPDPCSGSSSPEACDLYRSQVQLAESEARATSVANEAAQRYQATIAAVEADAAKRRAEGEAAINEASAQSTITALEIAQNEADLRSTIIIEEARQEATIRSGQANISATITISQAQVAAVATLTSVRDKSDQDRLNAAGLFIRDLVFYIIILSIFGLAGYWAVNYIRRKSAVADTPAGTILVLPAPNPFGARIYNPLLAESAVIDLSAPPQASRDDTVRRKQVVDLALAAARAQADVVNEGEVIEESGWTQVGQSSQPDQPATPALPLPGTFPRSQLVPPPSYKEIAAGWTPTPDRMLMAYTPTGQPIYGPLKNLMSMIVIGRPDFGKTTLERFIMVQCIQVGARAIVWDPHDNIADSLPGTEVCSTIGDVQRSCEQILSLLDYRIRNKLYNEQPILVIVDEFNLVADGVKEVVAVIRRIVTEGRKPGVYGIISAKGVPAASFGGEWVVGAFTGHYILNCRPSIARSANLETAISRQVELLQPGEAILECGRIPPQMVLIPNTTVEDVRSILLTSGGEVRSRSEKTTILDGNGSDPEVTPKWVGSEPRSEDIDPAKLEQIRSLMLRKASVKDITRQVFGAPSGGPAFQEALEELRRYQAVIAAGGG